MVANWIAQHWLDAAQTGGIVASILFAAVSLRDTRHTQRISNLFALTRYHRELYGVLFDRPKLHRIFSDKVDLIQHPVTEDERLFLTFVILHLDLALEATRMNAIVHIEGLERDLADLFSKPIPRAVWKEVRSVQNRHVVSVLDKLTGTTE
jgi:hypothetical protein